MDFRLTARRRSVPHISDVFEYAYDVSIGNEPIGTYYKLLDDGGWTASALAGKVYDKPGPCIVSILKEGVSDNMSKYVERELTRVALED